MTLDIIVPHYNEPWEEVSKLFDMLALQRFADFREFRVILVHDGEGPGMARQIRGRKYPYAVTEVSIPHGGVSAARNRGLEESSAKWVMFCDCDDTFTSVYSMHGILQLLDTEDYDLLWCPFYAETGTDGQAAVRDKFNSVFIHGKVFRRAFLLEHGIRFNEGLTYSEDTAFCMVAMMELEPGRIGKIRGDFVPYAWTYREGSATTDPARARENAIGLFRRQAYVTEELRRRGRMEEARATAYRGMCDAYVTLNRKDIDAGDAFAEEVSRFYSAWRDCGESADVAFASRVLRAAMSESYARKGDLPPEDGFWAWLAAFGGKTGNIADGDEGTSSSANA